LEKIFEDRVARALARMGIPGKDEVNGLAEKVQKLTKQVAELDKASAAKKAPPKKPVAKKATPKKTSSK
ncbi:MAG TPA: phasin family protein, partial [Xanthomonadales bacterium]|nr:phasin family protein [Xanthomonadales bacterium]